MGNMITMQILFSVFFIRVGENRPSCCEDKMRSNERSALKTVKGSTSQERRVKTRFSPSYTELGAGLGEVLAQCHRRDSPADNNN